VLDGPRTLNAQTPATWEQLHRAAENLPEGTRAVVLRGEGRAFSSGLDRSMFGTLADLGTRPGTEVDDRIAGYQAAFTCWRRPGVVSVAAVHGPAIGAGFQLALACDLRVAGASAGFRMAEPALGLVPDLAGTGPLVRAVGEASAVEICLSGRTVSATEAHRLGLVQAVVPDAELAQATDDLVRAVLESPAASVAATLDLLRGAGTRGPEQQLALERAAQVRLLRSRADEEAGPTAGPAEGHGPSGRSPGR
jgi:enoyl-CoA hydratase/carnithine racemase